MKLKYKLSITVQVITAFCFEFIMMLATTIVGLILNTQIDNGTIDSWQVILVGCLTGASMGFQCVAAKECFANCPPTTVMTSTLINVKSYKNMKCI